ncbi:MAG: ATP-dependent DNA helicase RecG [Candidatus Aenigmatarchaeota archaeon]
MELEDLEIPLTEFKGIGVKTAEKFRKNKILTIKDLLYFFPYRYDDLRNVVKIKEAKINEYCVIVGQIKNIKVFPTPKKKMILIQGIIEDETGSLKVIWYNQTYIAKLLSGAPYVMLYGKVIKNKYGLHLSNPDFKILERGVKFKGEIIPVYREISEIPSGFIRRIILEIFKKFPINKLQDPIPELIRIKANIPEISKALIAIHKPTNLEEIEKSRRRFLFEEIFYVQLKINQEKIMLKLEKSPSINYDPNLIEDFLQKINITLTNAQKEVFNEILNDLNKPYPMNRLIQGETGAGKTLIAELIALLTVNSGYMVIFMAPTEILANQHFHRFLNDFSYYDYGIGLLIKNSGYYGIHGFKVRKNKEDIIRLILSKKINILIGTHALIESPIPYPNVGLVIIDEQQRFGVNQRKKLLEKSSQDYLPHFISMTATPIPRTLYLAFYGDLDLSILKEKPPGRKDVKTYVVDKENINEVWNFARKEVEKGHQVFVICPRIEKSDTGKYEIRTVKEEYEKIIKLFPDYNVAMLHGKMNSLEKEMIMKKMQNGEVQILVASSVVEVGIDLPLATVIIIEGAERFGLSQLHQLRGRVGRSIHESYCFLIPEVYTPLSYKRLKILEESQDAFYIAEKDLEIRGPGELLGEKQSGIPDLAMEALSNIEIVNLAQKLAEELISQNPKLEGYPLLRREIEKRKEFVIS